MIFEWTIQRLATRPTWQRLQQAADPGRIMISEVTYRTVSGAFTLRPLGELPLKGKAEPIHAWEVVAAPGRTRLEVRQSVDSLPLWGGARASAPL